MTDDLAQLRRSLRNARRRLFYWAGIPTISGKAYRPRGGKQIQHAMNYETALCDAMSIAGEIERLTGRKPVVKDIRRDFQQNTCFGPPTN